MKYTVDRVEEEICVLENMESGDIIEVEISIFPFDIKEGNVVVYQNDEFVIDKDAEEDRRLSLRERMNKLKKEKSSGGVNENN